ncbi:glycosyltransferase [bacterium]|nr:glycosyltransferase [bacterium]
MKLSIVTPVLNGAKYIRFLLQSIESEKLRNPGVAIEHIIVDGGSIDSTLEICREFGFPIVYELNGSNQSEAINFGFTKASGQVFAWQNADDIYYEGFTNVLDLFENQNEPRLVYGNYNIIDKQGDILSYCSPPEFVEWKIKFGRFVPMQPTVFWDRVIWENLDGVSTSYKYAMDVDFFYRALGNYKFQKCNELIGGFRYHNNSLTSSLKNRVEILKDVERAYRSRFGNELLGLMKVRFYWIRSQVSGFVKRFYRI